MDIPSLQPRGPMRRAFLICSAVVVYGLSSLASPASAGQSPKCCTFPRAQDEVWLVSTRNTGCGSWDQQVNRLQYWRYDRQKSWVRAELVDLLSTDDPEVITTIFIHGNRIPYCEAFTKGWSAYRSLAQGADDKPIRFIIWSWPSEPYRGVLEDARIKAARTNPGGYHLAWFLDQLDPKVPVGLWAHSYGARIITGALHLLGGGNLCGYRLSERANPDRQPMQVVLMAAALDNHWLSPGHFHGRAMSQVSGLLLVNNGCDALLKRYHRLYGRRCCQQALGYTGMGQWGLSAADWRKVRQIDACCYVGRKHLFALYLCAGPIMAETRAYLLFQKPTKPTPKPKDVLTKSDAKVESVAS